MPREFEELRDGDKVEPYHFNIIYRELRRLKRMTAVPPLALDGMQGDSPPSLKCFLQPPILIRLTENGNTGGLHGWEEVAWNPGTPGYETTGLASDIGDGDGAREINGLKCPLGDDFYKAFRDNSGTLVFRAVRILAVCDGSDIAAGGSGSVTAWSIQSGSPASASLTLTAYNWNNGAVITAGSRLMLTPVASRWYADYEACSSG